MFLSGEAEAPGAAVGGGVGGVLPGGMRGQQPDSDDDFINDDGEEEEEGRGPSRKKIRTERGPAGNTKSASGCGEAPLYKLALSGAGGSGGHQPIKLLTVGTYKGRPHVDLREYFEVRLPGWGL